LPHFLVNVAVVAAAAVVVVVAVLVVVAISRRKRCAIFKLLYKLTKSKF